MSIADKLLYLNDTKTALADAINIALSARGEAPLDANATFRSYAERLFYPGYLFGQGEQGGCYLPPNAEAYFTDTAGTTPAAPTDAIALVQGEVGPDWTQGTATARPIWQSESGFAYLRLDLADDVLTTTLPAATYTVVLPTRQGIWIDEVVHAGGTFSIGPTSYTGGPEGILTALESDGVAKLVAPPLVIDRTLTDAERSALVRWYQARGAGINMPVSGVLIGYFNAGQTTDPLTYNASARTTTWFRVPEGASQGEFTADRGVFIDRFRVQLRDGAGVVTYAAPYGDGDVTRSAATLSIPPGTVDMRIYFTINPDPARPKFLMVEWS